MTTPVLIVLCPGAEPAYECEARDLADARRIKAKWDASPHCGCADHVVAERVWRDGAWVTTPIGAGTAGVTTPAVLCCDHCHGPVAVVHHGLYHGAYRHVGDGPNVSATWCSTGDGYIRVTVDGRRSVDEPSNG